MSSNLKSKEGYVLEPQCFFFFLISHLSWVELIYLKEVYFNADAIEIIPESTFENGKL